ncbi:sugar phosphate isomerase/epimerase family protein [Ligaoa zhengdingensis]|uniref:sugar phosphate isomerase/epimerase family protein n=1 Tax=Ligaoa zhengdingensis TaxID=2763658 RepID=UPI0031BBB152
MSKILDKTLSGKLFLQEFWVDFGGKRRNIANLLLKKRMRMLFRNALKEGGNMIYLGQLEHKEQMRALVDVYHLGLESYELGIGEALDDWHASAERFQRDLGPVCTEGLSLHGPFLDLNPGCYDSRVRAATMERFEACYLAAQHVGADRIIFHSGFLPLIYHAKNWLENSISFWKEFLAGKGDGIQIHLENLYDPYWEPIKRLLDEVENPIFTACLDVGHANVFSSRPVLEWLEGLGSHIGHFHLHNNDGNLDQHRALSDGAIPMKEFLKSLQENHFGVSCTLEINDAQAAKESLLWLESELGWDLSRKSKSA